MKNLDYTFNNLPMKGRLTSDEVYFFYYDVMLNTEDSACNVFEWDENIQNFVESKKLTINNVESISGENINDNCIYFLIDPKRDGTNKALAFFNHLRNAFAHFQIIHNGEFILLKDCIKSKNKPETITMLGKIKYEDLKKLCILFLNQNQKLIEEDESPNE